MSDTESVDYLQPGFDPWTMTMPRLRSLLVKHDVEYPASAKKGQLIEIFNEEVVPQSKKILAQRARAKRSSKGIYDAVPAIDAMESSQDTVVAAAPPSVLSDYDLMPPPRLAPPGRTPRKASSRRGATAESDESSSFSSVPASPTKRKTPARSRSKTAATTASDTDTAPEAPKSARKPRASRHSELPVSAAIPQAGFVNAPPQNSIVVKPEPGGEGDFIFRAASGGRDSAGSDSVFSSENPFQSGSPPPSALSPRTPSGGRRKTTGGDGAASGRSGDDTDHHRRRTEGGATATKKKADVDRKVSRSIEMPVSSLKPANAAAKKSKSAGPVVEAGEEFTPEEQLDLAQSTGNQAVARRRSKPSGGGGSSRLVAPLCLALVALLVYAGWYRQEKIAVGYCGVGRSAELPFTVPEWAQSLVESVPFDAPDWARALAEPRCELCPLHAFCKADLVAECEQDFVLKAHPLSLGGLVPLPPTCEPDGAKALRVKAVADKAVEELRDRRAKWECGELLDDEGKPQDSPAVDQDVLREVVAAKRSKKMAQAEFDDLWVAALGEIVSRDEIEIQEGVEDSTSTASRAAGPGRVRPTRLSSTSLARLPLICAVKRQFRLGLARYRGLLVGLGLLSLAGLYVRHRVRRARRDRVVVRALVDTAIDRLAAQKLLSDEEGEEYAEPFLFLPQLRDDALRATHSAAERERVWQQVRAVVEQNANVRSSQREDRQGEVGRAWEWIGPLDYSSSFVGGADGGGSDVGASGGGGSAWRRRSRGGPRVSWGRDVKGGDGAFQSLDGVVEAKEVAERKGADNNNNNNNNNNSQQHSISRVGLHQRWEEARPIY